MATTPSFVQVTEGVGKKMAAATYTENSQVVYDQKFIPGENYLPSYIATATVAVSTNNQHSMEVMAGSSLNVRIRRILAWESGLGTATVTGIQIFRLSTAGTGGTVITPGKLDTADASSGATAMTAPTVKGTETTLVCQSTIGLVAAAPIQWPALLFDFNDERGKPLIIPAGTSNGIAVKITSGSASASMGFEVWFDETSF